MWSKVLFRLLRVVNSFFPRTIGIWPVELYTKEDESVNISRNSRKNLTNCCKNWQGALYYEGNKEKEPLTWVNTRER